MEPAQAPHRPLRRLGQNFLRDPSIADLILFFANLKSNDTVLEPGPGYGELTRLLENRAGRVIAVEKDPYLAQLLKKRFSARGSVEVLQGDVLKIDLPPFNRVVGTPPYYISSKLVLFLAKSRPEKAHLVFQKEFGERLVAQPRSSNYGRISVTAQRALNIRVLMPVPRTAFKPVPKVDSVLVEFEPRTHENLDEAAFEELVRGVFTQRRRLLRSALLHHLRLRIGAPKARALLQKLSLPDSRVYELSVSQLENITIQLTEASNKNS